MNLYETIKTFSIDDMAAFFTALNTCPESCKQPCGVLLARDRYMKCIQCWKKELQAENKEMENRDSENLIENKNIAVYPIPLVHGETWFECPACGESFEYWDALQNKKRCTKCGQLFDLR